MSDPIAAQPKKPNWMTITAFILMALGFGGQLLENLSSRTSQFDTAITQMTTVSTDFKIFLEKDFKPFIERYNSSHEETAVAIKDLNTHIEYTDRRLAELEQRVKFGK
jgi:hypothetical protein